MSEMVERVARALCAQGGRFLEEISADERLVAFDFSRAAIEAMREPTDGMNRAAEIVGIDQDHRDYWAAMVDAALK